MKLFDEDGNYVGELFEDAKGKVEDAFEVSWFWGIIVLFIIAPGWTLLGLALLGVIKLIKLIISILYQLLLLLLRCLWFLIRLPFYLIFQHEMPEF